MVQARPQVITSRLATLKGGGGGGVLLHESLINSASESHISTNLSMWTIEDISGTQLVVLYTGSYIDLYTALCAWDSSSVLIREVSLIQSVPNSEVLLYYQWRL